MRRFFRRLSVRIRQRRIDRELLEEIETHRSLRQAHLEASGVPHDEAAQASRRSLGNVTLAVEDVHDIWTLRWLEEFARDLRHAGRLLQRSPAFTAVAVCSLALGIGANTAIFTLVDAVVLKPLPVDNPERLVVLERDNPRGEQSNFSYPLFEAIRTSDQIFSGTLAALDGNYRLEMAGSGSGVEREPVRVQAVSGEYFQVLGVHSSLGRLLTSRDERLALTDPIGVLSYSFWQRRFAGAASVIGQRVTVKGQAITIIGVAAAEFFGESVGRAPDLWVPLTMHATLNPPDLMGDPRVGWLRVMARLQPGTSMTQAQEWLSVRLKGFKTDTGAFGQSLRQVGAIALSPGRQGLSDTRTRFSQQLWILMAVVGLVLLIACANIANLLLVRGAARRREIAIRLAIGAGRGRLVRQFLAESLLLASIGGAVGLLLAGWGSQLLLALASDSAAPVAIDVAANARVLVFTVGISLATVLIFGLAPSTVVTRQDQNGWSGSAVAPARMPLTRMLVIAQVGLSLVLLCGAGLFLQTLRNLRAIDLGFAPDQIVQAGINSQAAGYTREQLPDLDRRLLERLNAAPGIQSATMATSGFRTGISRTCCVAIEGHIPAPGEAREVQTIGIGPDFFSTMGVPLLRGRPFTSKDVPSDPGSSTVAIINEAMARQYFGGEGALGRRFGWGDPPAAKYRIEVVGVAKNAIYGDLRERTRPLIYFPAAAGRYLIVRAENASASVASIVRGEVQAVDRNLAADVRPIPQILDQALLLERLLAKLSGFFGVLAALLAGIGIYGLMAHVVTSRTKEIGIRVALGAQQRRIIREIFRETLVLVAIGMVLGTLASLATTHVVANMLFGVLARDAWTLAMAAVALMVTAILASALPARRASLVEPSVALRQE